MEAIQLVITACPTGGDIVPVTRHVRDMFYRIEGSATFVIRYAYLDMVNTVLLITAFCGDEVLAMTVAESLEAESYISQQIDYFSGRNLE